MKKAFLLVVEILSLLSCEQRSIIDKKAEQLGLQSTKKVLFTVADLDCRRF